jgi:predicted alpha/beta superfamily hydrolase
MRSDYPQAEILGSHIRTLYSNRVDDEYELSIWLPLSYDTSKQDYPALYVLDSPYFFGTAVFGAAAQNLDGNVPEMIVVGIGKHINDFDEWPPFRARDYAPVALSGRPDSGHAATFLSFLDRELIPFVDTNYRTQRNDRTIWGHSLSGIFVLYLMFNRAKLFNRYIATSPAFVLEGETLLDPRLATTNPIASKARLFVSVGSSDQEFGPNIATFVSAMSASDIPDLTFLTSVLDGFGHSAAALPGFFQGLVAVFSS